MDGMTVYKLRVQLPSIIEALKERRFFGIDSRIRFLRGCLETGLFGIRQMFSLIGTEFHPVFGMSLGSSTLCKQCSAIAGAAECEVMDGIRTCMSGPLA